MIRNIQIMAVGVVGMNYTFHHLKVPIPACSKETTGLKINRRHEPSGQTQMIPLFQLSTKKPMEEIAKPSGAGVLIFKMILLDACNGPLRILMNAIILRFPWLQAAIILR